VARALTLPARHPFDRRGVLAVMRVLRFNGPVAVRFSRLDEAGVHRRAEDGMHHVAIANDLSDDEAARVLVHELAHCAQAATARAWPDDYHADPDRYEAEAELAAVCLYSRVLARSAA
jgi:hypothetical protein